jgi:tagaturonate reductase
MKGKLEEGKYYGHFNGNRYLINDENAGYFSELWFSMNTEALVKNVLGNISLWGLDLNQFKGFADTIGEYLEQLMLGKALSIIEHIDDHSVVGRV